jgi:hypothetical protein
LLGKWFTSGLRGLRDAEAFRIQVEYFHAQLKGAALDAGQIGAKMAGSSKTFISSRTEHRVEHRSRQWRIRPCVFTAGRHPPNPQEMTRQRPFLSHAVAIADRVVFQVVARVL